MGKCTICKNITYKSMCRWTCCGEYVCYNYNNTKKSNPCMVTFYIKHPYRNCKTKEPLQNNLFKKNI